MERGGCRERRKEVDVGRERRKEVGVGREGRRWV